MQGSYPDKWLPAASNDSWNPSVIPKAQSMYFHYLWYPTPRTQEDWIEASQRHQEWITRLMTEAFRRLPGMNTFAIHLFIDAWPSGWMKTIMDVNRIPKRAWFAYRDALAPLALSLRTDLTAGFSGETLQVEVWLANDLDEIPKGCMIDYEIRHDGKALGSGTVTAKPARCAPAGQGMIAVVLPDVSERNRLTLTATLLDNAGFPLHETHLELGVFPPCSESRHLAGMYGNQALGMNLPDGEDTILITDVAAYLAAPEDIDQAVQAGATAVLLPLPTGTHNIGSFQVEVRRAGMGPRHFVSCDSGHPIVEKFERDDFKFWFDESLGHVSPILDTILEADGWTPILLSGDGGWDRPWGPMPVAAERSDGLGCWRICQVAWANRMRTNPVARLLAKNLLTPVPRHADTRDTNATYQEFPLSKTAYSAELTKHKS